MIDYYKGDAYDIGKLYKLTASYLKSPVYEILAEIRKSGSHPFKSEGGGFYSKAEPVCKTMLGEVKGAPRVTRFDSMQELVRNVTDEFVSNAGCDYKASFADCTGDFFENKEIRQESKMKHKNTEDYYNEQAKDSKFAPSFDNLTASAKNHWEREFDKYARDNTPVDLEDGAPYKFEFNHGDRLGFYCELDGMFISGSMCFTAKDCTNIVKLVPEVK